MQRRVVILLSTAVLTSIVLGACKTRTTSEEDDKKAAIAVVLAHEQGVQTFDFDRVASLHAPGARGIEESYPHLSEPNRRAGYEPYKDAGVHFEYHPQDAVAEVRGDVAWVTVTLHSAWTTDTPAGRTLLGANTWHATYVESFVLVRTPEGWKIALGHTSILPPDLGVEADYQQEHGGMKLAKVREGGPAGKAGFQAEDVMIEYGGRKIDNPDDFYRLRYVYYEGEQALVIVMRGHEKITKEVTLEAMK